MDSADDQAPQAATTARDTDAPVELNPYQLALTSFVFPYSAHFVFGALGALPVLLLGHPIIAACCLFGAMGIDVIHQGLTRRWLASSAGVDPVKGIRRVAAMSAVRISVYLAPLAVMAIRGGAPELFLFAIEACVLIALAFAISVLSRLIFWAFALPVVTAAAIVASGLGGAATIAGGLIAVAGLGVLLMLLSNSITQTSRQWLNNHAAKVAVIPELRAARQRAEEARVAAEAAHEAASRADLAKSNFLASMSHEIRTPMNGVLGMAQLLRRDETNPRKRERLDMLLESGEHLLSLLNDVLDLSRIDAGKLQILPAEENLRLFLDRLVGLWDARAEQKGLILALEMSDSVPDSVLIDGMRLRQVMSNLVANAIKFTDAGRVDVIVTARSEGRGATMLRLTVRDTGRGIEPARLADLFQRFSQGDETQARQFGGAGLGLAIARQLVELMGGRIAVDSQPDVGSSFHVELPVALTTATTQPVPPRALAPPEPSRLRVLAVDDNAVNLIVLEQLLKSLGYGMTKASDGREALELLGEQAFDLVLLDLHMPGMTGLEVLDVLRSSGGRNQDVHVIALTADVTSGGRGHYLQLGFSDYVCKPIQISDLAEALAGASVAEPRRQPAPAGRAAPGRGRGP